MSESGSLHTVRDVMTPRSHDQGGEHTVLGIARLMARTGQTSVPIAAEDGTVEGMVTPLNIALSLGLGNDPATTRASEIIDVTPIIEADAPLEEAKEFLKQRGGVAAVADGGYLVGHIEVWEVEKYLKGLDALGGDAAHLITELSPQDRTAQAFRGGHLLAGVSALKCIRKAIAATGRDTVANLLDFPSGYGRILRVLKAAFPDARVAAGDIDHDAVDFCARVFGAVPIYSVEEPEQIEIHDTFDLIWSGSLLTHIRPDRWPGFLSMFRSCLAPDGLLVFTTHGPGHRSEQMVKKLLRRDDQVQRVLNDYDRDGVGYADYLNQDNYGISLSSPEWVRQQLQRSDLRVASYLKQGWYAPGPNHDVFACVPV